MGGKGSGRKKVPVGERFWSYVNKPVDDGDEDACWEWVGATTSQRDDTGVFWDGFGSVRVPRFIWELTYGKVPPGGRVTQECGNRRCVRPTHLLMKERRPVREEVTTDV